MTILALSASPVFGHMHKLDNLFSYKSNSVPAVSQHSGKERNLILGFGMSEGERDEERRQESRKDDVKNLIKVRMVEGKGGGFKGFLWILAGWGSLAIFEILLGIES